MQIVIYDQCMYVAKTRECNLKLKSMVIQILMSILLCIQDPKLLAALQESRKRQAPYAGAFLLKDEPEADPSAVSSSDTDKNVYDLKGKELFNRLHEVGTLAQVCDWYVAYQLLYIFDGLLV